MHRHVSPADADVDGDGAPDAVALDFDGDGRVDDALWDTGGDGAVDVALLDLDDDGRGERGFADPSGRGVWDAPAPRPHPIAPPHGDGGPGFAWSDVRGRREWTRPALDSDGDSRLDAAAVAADHDPATAELVCDLDADSRADQLLVDRDRDGRFESAYLSSAGPAAPTGRWDVLLADIDADGAVDTVVAEGSAGWSPP